MGCGMAIGLAVKQFVHWQATFFKLIDRVLPFAVWALLFLLGISVGSNQAVVSNLGSLGFDAFLVAVAATGMSVLLSIIVFRLFFKHES